MRYLMIKEDIERIVARQFDLVTNLTQPAYEDSLKIIGEQIHSLIYDPDSLTLIEDKDVIAILKDCFGAKIPTGALSAVTNAILAQLSHNIKELNDG